MLLLLLGIVIVVLTSTFTIQYIPKEYNKVLPIFCYLIFSLAWKYLI